MRVRGSPLLRALIPVPPSRPRSHKRSRAQHARAVVLLGLALIVAAQIGMSAAVETVKPEWRDPEYGHRLKRLQSLVQAHPDRPLVVALGSSRTQMGLSPEDMGFADEPGSPLVFNFAQAGAGPIHMRLTLDRLLDAGIRPRFLLVEFYPIALITDEPELALKSWGPRLSLADLRRLEPHCRDISQLRREWLANRIAPWHSLRLILMSHWQPNWLVWHERLTYQWEQMDAYGWIPFPYQPVLDFARKQWIEQLREQHGGILADYRIGASSDRALRDIIERCRRENIAIALYWTPEGPAFRSWYSPWSIEKISAYAGSITREYGVPLFDSADGFAEEEFADSHHLLKSGAARFSRRLADEHLRHWVGEPTSQP